ncbi:hypothetical protein [Niabella aquatica]
MNRSETFQKSLFWRVNPGELHWKKDSRLTKLTGLDIISDDKLS